MVGMIDWQFVAKGASGRAHFERGKDVFVFFDGEEVGRIPSEELLSILSVKIPLDGRATRLVERIQDIMRGEIYERDVAAGLGRLQKWIDANGDFTEPPERLPLMSQHDGRLLGSID